MRGRILLLAAFALLVACQREPASNSDTPPEIAAIADPVEVVAPLYERYRTDPAVTTFPALPEQAPWSADMRARLEAMMARSEALNEPILDFDPFVNAQDWRVGVVAVTGESLVEHSHAVVRAHFVNAGHEDEVVYDLVWEGDAWRVDNIRHADWDLRQIVSQGA
jgi:hypothetical protein